MSYAIASPPLGRFLWKEYRMVRGLWLAVLVLGLLIDWLLGALLAPPTDFPTVRLCVALAAATLYAAGAAAVLFSVEHEEQTYDFLRGLPTTWGPLFAGKLVVATASAIALALALGLIAVVAGSRLQFPADNNAPLAFSVLGVAIFEALAWGTLCSLIFKRPLAAALTTIIVGPLVVSWAVSAISSSSVPLNDPASFAAAIPLRLAIVVALFVLSLIVARRWLVTKTATASTSSVGSLGALAAMRSRIDAVKSRAASRVDRSRPRAMILRLLWQSWRESWKFLVVPMVLAAVCLAIGLGGGRLYNVVERHNVLFPILASCLFCSLAASPALLGALAFSADQRRGGVRFLAEHAAAPRIVWLSRHVMWLGMLIALVVLVVVAAATLLTSVVQTHLQAYQRSHDEFEALTYAYGARELRSAIASGLYAGTTAMTFLWCGALAAYAIGQFCSMLLRSEILSAFTSLVLAVVLIPWIAALLAWDLSSWLFLLPLAIAFFGATWFRAPHWIAGRNSWRTWVWPAVVIVGALAFIGITLPQIRLLQVRSVPSPRFPLRERSASIAATPESAAAAKRWDEEATATANMYLKAAEVLQAFSDENLLKPWKPKELMDPAVSGSNVAREEILRIIESQVPDDQKASFQAAEQRFLGQWKQKHTEALRLASAASERLLCRFNFPLARREKARPNRSGAVELEPSGDIAAMNRLINSLIYEPINFGGPIGFDQLFTALKLNYHMRFEQPTAIALGRLRFERTILERIANWAGQKEHPNEERRAALDKLQTQFRRQAGIADAFAADRKVIRKVVNGEEPPLILASQRSDTAAYLAFIANELPWERERALVALDLITDQNLFNADRLRSALLPSNRGWGGIDALRLCIRPTYRPAMWVTQQPAAATKYLVRMEYELRVPVNELFLEYCHTVTAERATLLQIALAMYRADHGQYPLTLEALVPKYLETLPLDPFSAQSFQYRSTGFERLLKCIGTAEANAIAPGTPLLWSIGPDNLHIREGYAQATNDTAETESPGPEDTPMRDLSDRASDLTFYVLDPADWDQRYTFTSTREFVFTLPK